MHFLGAWDEASSPEVIASKVLLILSETLNSLSRLLWYICNENCAQDYMHGIFAVHAWAVDGFYTSLIITILIIAAIPN